MSGQIAAKNRSRRTAWVTRIAIFVGLIVVWQLAAMSLGPLFLPLPLAVVKATVALFGNGTIELALEQSMTVFLTAFAISLGIGIPLGLVMGGIKAVGDAVDSFINLFNSMPRIALIPLMVAWFGLGVTAKIAIVVLLAFFPIVINTYNGVLNTDEDLLEAASSFGASKAQLFTSVMLRAALSNIITGIRLGASVGILGVVVAELFTAITGLGGLIVNYGNTFQLNDYFVPVLVLSVIGASISEGLKVLERKLTPWKSFQR
ncbi:MAG TPA: ABC transporter permease [Nitrososphaerales archaeon]|nr:ABC transporter permease [Nitrososphaerales archaeon]